MKKIVGSLLLAGTFLAGCGSDNGTPDGGSNGFPQPAGTVAVNFVVDDTANKQWKSQELEWKGGMIFDSATRIITADSTWGGPWAKLYDDGPWDQGGHEPKGSVAGDHKLGVTIFVKPPTTGTGDKYEYGLRDATNPDPVNGGWVWRASSNGSFTVTPAQTGEINAPGQTFPAHGTIDLKLTINKNDLDPGATWDTSAFYVKGSGWGWSDVQIFDDGTHGDDSAGDGIYTFVLTVTAADLLAKPPYPGPFSSGDKPEFVFDLGATKKEYKVNSICSKTGVHAYTKASGGSFVEQTITTTPPVTGGFGGNTTITVP